MSTVIQIHSSIHNVLASFNGVLLDAYGVFWGGNGVGLFPGAKEIMSQLVSSGKAVGILSNSTQLVAEEMEKYHKHGIVQGTHYHFLITSGEVARSLFCSQELPFKTVKKKFWLFGSIHPKFSSHQGVFQESPYTETDDLREADFIYISIPHLAGEDQIDPELFRASIAALKEYKLPMVCASPDRFAHEGSPPRAVVRQGTIARMYEEMGGSVFYIGKPAAIAYEAAMNEFEGRQINNPAEILMVGDTPETDIRGARSFGMGSALVTQTGIMADRILHHGLEEALRALPKGDIPEFYIETLAR